MNYCFIDFIGGFALVIGTNVLFVGLLLEGLLYFVVPLIIIGFLFSFEFLISFWKTLPIAVVNVSRRLLTALLRLCAIIPQVVPK